MTTFKPRPYQELIIDHILSHPRCMVWAGMGMGKTVSALSAVRELKGAFGPKPTLVVAPLRVAMSTWPEELSKWDHLKVLTVSVVAGKTPAARLEAVKAKADIYCVNYEQLPWLVGYFQAQGRWPFRTIICDEATRLKGMRLSGGTKRAKALAKVAFLSERFVELTGTPTANGLIDLWGQAWFIDKGLELGRTMHAYQQAYFYPVKTGGEAYMVKWLPLVDSDKAIRSKLSKYALTVNAEQWFSFTEPVVNDILVTLPPKAQRIYKAMDDELMVELSKADVEAANALSKVGKCLQIASGSIYLDDTHRVVEEIHDEKIQALESVVEEASGAPILVAYQFVHEARRILARFPKAKLLTKDPKVIRDWNVGKIPMLVAHPASCGHGLNLQDGGNILVFFSLGFNYEQYAQMCERIGPTRQAQSGHPRTVFIHRIMARGTLDQSVAKALEKKKDVLDFILDRRKG